MSPGLYLRQLRRESRGQAGRLVFFLACLGIGVAAVVSVATLAASLDRAIRNDARQLLAADLVINSRGSRPLSPELEARLGSVSGGERADLKELVTIVAAPTPPGATTPGASRLVELKAASGGYPFYGRLELEPAAPLAELLAGDSVVVGPELLATLGLEIGDSLRVGGEAFVIRGLVRAEPDRIAGAFSAGPRVFLSLASLERAQLEQRGSRVERRVLFKMPEGSSPEQLTALAQELKSAAGRDFRVETYAQGQPMLRNGIARAERFLGLVALLSLLAGGIGVAQTVRSWLAGRMDSIAILRCLGMRPGEVFWLFLGQTALLGLAGSVVGVVLGLGIAAVVPQALGDLIPAGAVRIWQPMAILKGLGLGTGVALLFSLPPLASLRRVPPARVFRRDADPLPPARWLQALLALAVGVGVLLLATAQSGSFRLAGGFTLGMAATTAALGLAAWTLTRWASRLKDQTRRSVAVSYALAALARPGGATLTGIVALGLGVLVVLGMWLVESQLVHRLRADLPKDAPTVFLVDIQRDQWPGVEQLIRDQGALSIDSVPVITARISQVNERSTTALAEEAQGNGERRWALTREQRLTYLEALPPGNRIVEGALWSLPDQPEVSVEKEFADSLGLTVGSTLDFDIQGVPLRLTVSSLRSVEWQTFGINFYLVVEPGVLEDAPQQRVAAAQLPEGREQALQDRLVARFPNVLLINVRALLEKVTAVMERIGTGIRLVGGFTVLAGIAILAGAVAATSARRGREVALLKTLGLTRAGVATVFSVEYSLVGLVAGIIGSVGGGALAWVVLTRGMEVPWHFDPLAFLLALVASVILAVLSGLAASARALSARPLEVMRSS